MHAHEFVDGERKREGGREMVAWLGGNCEARKMRSGGTFGDWPFNFSPTWKHRLVEKWKL